jgi:hypothetical protein
LTRSHTFAGFVGGASARWVINSLNVTVRLKGVGSDGYPRMLCERMVGGAINRIDGLL